MFAMGGLGPRPRTPSSSAFAAALALLVGLGLTLPRQVASAFEREELLCEEAATHLARCCPGMHPDRLSCTFVDEGCSEDGRGIDPDLSESEGRCWRALSCDEIRGRGVCTTLADPEGGAPRCE